MKNILLQLSVLSILLILNACVPARQFDDEKAKRINCESQNAELKTKNQNLNDNNKDLNTKLDDMNRQNKNLRQDTVQLNLQYKKVLALNDKLDKLNTEINDKLKEQTLGSDKENKKILTELQSTKESLIKKEDDLKQMEKELNSRQQNLNDISEKLKANQVELDQKQKKLEELQSVLNKKDSVVKALKSKVSDALLGFENKGLTIQQKNGKVYVSMEEALLFPSGSFAVNKRGSEALKKLAMVLEVNPDINVLVEGHTDNVPYKNSGQLRDNWDLSVMRATTIVKTILEGSKIDPARLSASGRSQYSPLDVNTTSEGRAKNRRTEIILTPKLDELFKIIETN